MFEKYPQEPLGLEEALKRVRGLYYKNKIAVESKGSRGEIVKFKELSDADRDALITLRDSRIDIPLDMRNFVFEVTKESLDS